MKVVIVAAYSLIRRGLYSILSNQLNIQLTGEASTIEEGIMALLNTNPDIVLVDANLGSKSGLDLFEEARQQGIKTKFILLGIYQSKDFFLRSMNLGVEGHILREANAEEVLYAINQVYKGKKYYDSELFQYMHSHENENEIFELTPREREILIALGKGMSNYQIAHTYYITENTVKKHISKIFAKLHLHDRVQAAIFVNSKGIVG